MKEALVKILNCTNIGDTWFMKFNSLEELSNLYKETAINPLLKGKFKIEYFEESDMDNILIALHRIT